MSTTGVDHSDGPEPNDAAHRPDADHRPDSAASTPSGSQDADSAGLESDDGERVQDWSMGRRGALLAAIVALCVIIVDQGTKAVALDRLTLGRPIHVIGTLDWNLVYNRGSAFGIGQGLGPLIGVFASVVAIAMLALAARAPRPAYALVYGMVAGGAIGNVLDRVFRAGTCPVTPCDGFLRGAVIDFIDLNWWPVFNVADMAVVCGVIAVAVGSILAERS